MQRERPNILVVEDEGIVAMSLQQKLGSLGYEVPETASSAEEAIEIASRRCPDLVLMDIGINGSLDGIQAAELLQSRYKVPVVYLTAYSDQTTLDRAKKTLPYGYLLKPFNEGELRTSVEVALHKHQMDLRLRERERWFATTLRSIGDGVISTDAKGIVNFMNMTAELLTGWRKEDADGRPLSDVLKLVHKDREATTIVGREGDERPIHETSAAILDDDGRTMGSVLVFRDVSEQRQLQKQLELADRLASLGTMAAAVAHEINTPLTFITANVRFAIETLRGDRNAPGALDRAHEALEEVEIGTERVKRIAGDLKELARPAKTAGVQVNLATVLDWAINVTSHDHQHRARIVRDYAVTPDVFGDETRLGQVFTNLLINAAHAIEPGAPHRNEIRVAVGVEGGHATVTIQDSGCGMSASVVPRIFDPFFTTKAPGAGTGLGLSISNGIVRSLGGHITVASLEGRGTTFRVMLPIAHRTKEQERAAIEGLAYTRRARVMVVDDEPLMRSTLRRSLSPDHEVVTCAGGAEALERIEAGEHFDAILCDVMMPEMDGPGLYRRLLATKPELIQRLVFISGGAFTTHTMEFLASVRCRLIEKPFAIETLRAIVEKVGAL